MRGAVSDDPSGTLSKPQPLAARMSADNPRQATFPTRARASNQIENMMQIPYDTGAISGHAFRR
jgi:hypothetical protein